jgi:choline dehydrogenase-like flavoprotein
MAATEGCHLLMTFPCQIAYTRLLQTAAFSSKEVILCAGAFDSPKIMFLSGIGPSGELASHSIATLHDLLGAGKIL